mgnify:CR=1 FL=1
MIKSVRQLAIAGVFGAAAGFMVLRFGGQEVRELKARVDFLEQERTELIEYAKRLTASRRVAQVDVLNQSEIAPNRFSTTLRWQEIADNGELGDPQQIDVFGTFVYFEAMVLKFEHDKLRDSKPGEYSSLALFRRMFGDQQEPASAQELPATAIAGVAEPTGADSLGQNLFDRFWSFLDDDKLRERYGVRIAQLEAPAVPVKPGQRWQVSLDAAGGLNLELSESAARPAAKPGISTHVPIH